MPGESQRLPESVPDPSVLTTQQLDRGLAGERDYVDGKFAVLEERLAGMDRATALLSETVHRTPTEIQKEVTHLRELSEEKFTSIGVQFRERDTRSERESRDNKVAVDAAFAAQKEAAAEQNKSNTLAITKSEVATAETIRTLSELFRSTTDALAAQIADLKERVARAEAIKVGGAESKASLYAALGFSITVVIAAITVIGFVVGTR